MRIPHLFRFRRPAFAQVARVVLSTSVIALLGYTTSRATDRYWDSNGTTPGGSDTTTAPGNWGTSNFWNSDSLGGAGTFTDTTFNTDDLHFSAGTNVTGASAVAVTGAQVANSLIFEEGAVTLSGGTSITLGGGGGNNTGLTFVSGTGTNTISTAVILAADAAFTNGASTLQTISGAITGTANLTLKANSTGGITLSTGGVNIAGLITNSGAGTGGVTISGTIGANVTGIVQNSLTSSLTISGANSAFAGPVTIKAGSLILGNSAAIGTATVTLGDVTGGNNAATLLANSGATIANNILLASNTTGPLTIGNNGTTAATFNGSITGTNNLIINTGSTVGTLTFGGSAGINNTGTVTHTGTGTGVTTINSIIGANVTQVIQNSATSQMTLANGANQFGSLWVKAGTVQLGQNGTATQTSAGGLGTITLGDNTGSAAAILQLQGTVPNFSNPLVLGSTTGLLTLRLQNTGTSATFTGGITGNNNLTISTAGTGAGTAQLTFLTGDINNTGTITNGTVGGTGNLNIQSVIGANVTGVIQNSATSKMVLSNQELYNAPTNVLQGILELASGASLSASAVHVAPGATLLISSDPFLGAGTTLTVDGGGILSTLNNAISTITLDGLQNTNSIVNFGVSGTGPAVWNLDAGITADQIFFLSDTQKVTIGAQGLTVNVTNIGGTISHTDQQIISAAGGVTVAPSAPLTVNATTGNFGGYVLGLQARSDGLWLTETANPTPAVAYWSGALSTAWNFFSGGNANNSNWLNGPAGTDTHAAPGATTNVFLTANTAGNLATTLGQNFEINSLTFTGTGTAGSGTVSVGGAFSLKIDATGVNGNTAGVGIVKQIGSGANTISAPVILGGSQSWTNNASTNLAVTGGVTGTADLTLNATNTGAITISGTNPLDITGAIISGGNGAGAVTLSSAIGANVTSITQASATHSLVINTNPLNLTNGITLANSGGGAFTISTGVTGTGDLTLKNNSAIAGGVTFSTAAINHTGKVINAGTGTGSQTIAVVIGSNVTEVVQNSATSPLILTGVNTYTGPTTILAGPLILSGAGSIATSSGVTINGSTARLVQSSSVALAPVVTLTQGTVDGTTTINTVNVANSTGTAVTAGNGGAGTLTIGTLTFGGASNINLAATGTTMSSTLAVNSLITNAAGNVLINLTNNNGLWGAGTYNLFTYGGGSIGGAGFSAFQVGTIANLAARQVATLNNTGSAVTLSITAGDTLIWTGALDGRWTTATLADPKNWKLQTAGGTTDFMTNDVVLFNDSSTRTTVTISDANVSPVSTTFNNSTTNYVLNGPFGISGGSLTKQGTGTLTINTANTYAGATTIQNGRIILGLNNALPTGTSLVLGNNLTGASSTVGILDLNGFNQTIGALAVLSDSTTLADQILIGSGKTLTINGNVSVGENNTAKSTVKLTMSGGGSLVVNNTASGGVFQVGANATNTTTSGNNATADLSGLSSVTISLNTVNGAVNVGDPANGTANTGVASTLLLPTAGNTTITASAINIGTQGRNSVNATDNFVNTLKLGGGANTFNVNTLNVGTGNRDAGALLFTNGSGTLTLRDASGTGRAALNIGTGASNTGANRTNTFDASGHAVDLLVSTLTIGNGIGTGLQTNVFTMDAGVLDATSLIMGRRADGGGTGSAKPFTTTVTFGANASSTETVTIGAGGITLLNQSATIAASSANATDNSTLNILGGTVIVNGDITQTVVALASNHNGTLNLNGGTLDMTGKKIGGSTAATNIDTLIFASGTLKNVAEINNGAGLTKTTSGTLTIAGTNTYTGATTVKAGTVVVSGSITGSAAVVVGDSANLTTSAILGGSGTLGNLTVGAAAGNTGATLMPHAGSTSTSAGNTLTASSLLLTDSAVHLSLELGRTSAFLSGGGDGTAGGDRSDHVASTGTVTLNGADLDLSLLTTTGYNIGQNDVFFLIINGSGSAINGTFGALNGVATSLTEGAQFTFNSQQYTITYQANFAGNSYTGGNDVAVMLVSVPEPGALPSLLGGLSLLLWRRRRRS